MADYDASGPSDPVAGASRSLEQVTAAELMTRTPESGRPDWMVTRYPVSMEEFARLNELATQPDTARAAVPNVIEDRGADTEQIELPEDESAIAVAAPTPLASFDGIPQTQWQPPDCTIAVGPNEVLVAVNSDLAGYNK